MHSVVDTSVRYARSGLTDGRGETSHQERDAMNHGFAGYIRQGVCAALIALAFLLTLSETAFADVSIAAYPTFLEFSGDPGASTTQFITVSNGGSSDANISIAIGDVKTAL